MTPHEEMIETKTMWLSYGRFHCDEHRPVFAMPFYFAPLDAKCAECSHDADESKLARDKS